LHQFLLARQGQEDKNPQQQDGQKNQEVCRFSESHGSFTPTAKVLSQDYIHILLCPTGLQTRRETAVTRGDLKITPPQHGQVITQAT